jgi:hypothetical protein
MRGQAHRLRSFLLFVLLVCLVPLSSCIGNRMYRPQPNSVVAVPPLIPIDLDSHKAKVSSNEPCNSEQIVKTPCLAFLEFDDLGEPWERNPSGRPAQLSRALDLIRDARKKDPYAVVLVFIHGWKHSAAGSDKEPEDTNITGFKAVLQRIHEEYVDPGTHHQHAVLGVYVAWRGGLVSPNWPVAQQFSYFNREAAAIRVGDTSLTDALVELSDAVQSMPAGASGPSPARIVMIGHSFGALVLEHAISQAMIMSLEKQYEQQNSLRSLEKTGPDNETEAASRCGYPGAMITQPLANLIVFVNSAAGANESKQMMDYLASSHFTYQTAQGPQPLFLSVTSKTDTATGVIFKIGHGASWLGYWASGSMRPKAAGDPPNPTKASHEYARVCYDTSNGKSSRLFDMSQTSFYLTTTAHSPQLQSHLVNETLRSKFNPVDDECSHGAPTSRGKKPVPIVSCNMAQYNFTVVEKSPRCNGTPYWAMEVPTELIPDHTTIFTDRLITFLTSFVSTTALAPSTPRLCRPNTGNE